MSKKSALYYGYTLAEVLVVLMIVIVLGGVGAYSFGGLRDSVLVKQNIEEIKQDLQLVQQKAMLLERRDGEGWIYGIGIDFTQISEGKYTFFKWCSPFASYGDIRTRSEIIGFNPEQRIGHLEPYGNNGVLPLDNVEPSGVCNRETISPIYSYMTSMPGMEEGKIHTGFNISLLSPPSYVVFESVTGRAFLYDSEGLPVNYNDDGSHVAERWTLGIVIFRNRGAIADVIEVSDLSGSVLHMTVDDPEVLGLLRSVSAQKQSSSGESGSGESSGGDSESGSGEEGDSGDSGGRGGGSGGGSYCTPCVPNPKAGGIYCITLQCPSTM